MANSLVINCSPHETRAALLEDGQVVELAIERRKDEGILGNVYKGRVTRVLPGMQAAFVDIGLERAAFLYVADVADSKKNRDLNNALTEVRARRLSPTDTKPPP